MYFDYGLDAEYTTTTEEMVNRSNAKQPTTSAGVRNLISVATKTVKPTEPVIREKELSARGRTATKNSNIDTFLSSMKDFARGVSVAIDDNIAFGAAQALYPNTRLPQTTAFYLGKITADVGNIVFGILMMTAGAGGSAGGVALSLTGVGAVVGIPAISVSTVVGATGVAVTARGSSGLLKDAKDLYSFAKGNKGAGKSGFDKQKKGTPINNQAQNKQVRDVVNELKLNKEQQRLLHDEISGQGYSYREILGTAKDMFNK